MPIGFCTSLGWPGEVMAQAPKDIGDHRSSMRAAVEAVVDSLLQEFARQPATLPGKTADERTEVPPAG
jgi:hypothetical protein